MAKLCFNLFLAISLKLKVSVKLKPQTLLFCILREVQWGSVSVPVAKAEYYSFTVRKRWKQTCLFRWHFSGNITQTRPLILKLLPSSCLSDPFFKSMTPVHKCCVHLAWTQADGALSIPCTTWVKVVENQSSLPSEQTYGRGAPWTPAGDGD